MIVDQLPGDEDGTDTLTDLMTDDYTVLEKNPNHYDANDITSEKLNMCLVQVESTAPTPT